MRRLILVILLVFISTVSAYVAYHFTKSNYLEVGSNNGNIQAKHAVIKEIDALLPKARVCSDDEYKNWKNIISVKTASIYFKQIDETSVMVCIVGFR